MLIQTLDELLTQAKKYPVHTVELAGKFNKRIMEEILEASENHCLAEYLGIIISKETLGKTVEKKKIKK